MDCFGVAVDEARAVGVDVELGGSSEGVAAAARFLCVDIIVTAEDGARDGVEVHISLLPTSQPSVLPPTETADVERSMRLNGDGDEDGRQRSR
eukprot:scaffold7017_cov170-Alexandrium_tamarense.AAC.4